MNKDTFKELWEEDKLEQIEREVDDSWRHGCYVYEIYKDETGKYFSVSYQLSTDGEYHGIRENDFDLYEVEPVKVIVETTEWKVKE